MDKRIQKFIEENKVASIAVVLDCVPHSFNCFYAFNEFENTLVFKSSERSFHSKIIETNPVVSGTIYKCSKSGIQTEGVQITGNAIFCNNDKCRDIYYFKYPFARVIYGSLFQVNLLSVKYTSNNAGLKTILEHP